MATHFNAAGEPDGRMPKTAYLVVFAAVFIFIITKLFLAPAAIERMPAARIRLPNRDFWLSTAKRAETFAIVRSYFEWFTVALAALLIAINELVMRANLTNRNLSRSILFILLAYLIFVAVWLTKFVLRFKRRY